MDRNRFGLILIPIYIALFAGISTYSYSNFPVFLSLIAAAFITYFLAIKYKIKYVLPLALLLIIGTRIPFFFNLPQLSDDFYRFIWDGMLLFNGLNPIGRIPVDQVVNNFNDPGFANLLIANMNSANYASVYPPFHQMIFGLSYVLAGSNLLQGVNTMRAIISTLELLTFVILLVRRPTKEQNYFFAYLLNPLVIVEGVGNIHFEAVALPFMAIALIDYSKKWYLRSAIPWAGSILVKLRAAILAPVFFFRFPKRKRLPFVIATSITLCVFFGMFEEWRIFSNADKGIGLYFTNFEFNASLYYLIRNALEPIVGYNPIAILSPVLAIIAFVSIVFISYKRRNSDIFELGLVVYLIFLLLATTVHPWYIIPVVYLAIRTGRQYILIWSFVAFLSYTRYLGDGEPKWIFLAIEYTVLFGAIFMEGRRRKWLQPAFRG